MKAVVLRELGAPENLRVEDVTDPQPKANEVVIRLRAAAVNHRDVFIRKGQYAGIKLPIILGSDGAGEVVTAGAEVDQTLIGKAVIINPSLNWGEDERVQGPAFRILGLPDHGTYAQLIKVPASNVHAKPASLSFEEASAIPLSGSQHTVRSSPALKCNREKRYSLQVLVAVCPPLRSRLPNVLVSACWSRPEAKPNLLAPVRWGRQGALTIALATGSRRLRRSQATTEWT